MEQLRSLLSSFFSAAAVIEAVARNIDTNNSGIDDETADMIKKIREIGLPFLAAIPQNTSTVAKGLEGIRAFGTNVINGLKALQSSTLPVGDRLSAARELAAMLDDDTKVYQPKKGKDKKLLDDFKKDAAEIVAVIESP